MILADYSVTCILNCVTCVFFCVTCILFCATCMLFCVTYMFCVTCMFFCVSCILFCIICVFFCAICLFFCATCVFSCATCVFFCTTCVFSCATCVLHGFIYVFSYAVCGWMYVCLSIPFLFHDRFYHLLILISRSHLHICTCICSDVTYVLLANMTKPSYIFIYDASCNSCWQIGLSGLCSVHFLLSYRHCLVMYESGIFVPSILLK